MVDPSNRTFLFLPITIHVGVHIHFSYTLFGCSHLQMILSAVGKLIRNFHIGNQLPALFKAFTVCQFLSEKPDDRFNKQTAQSIPARNPRAVTKLLHKIDDGLLGFRGQVVSELIQYESG